MHKLNTEEIEALVAQAGADPLAVAVHGLNVTLAHHAAWTEEGFEKVNERFDAVEQREAAMELRFDSLDKRFDAVQVVLSRLDTRTSDTKGLVDQTYFSTSLRGRKIEDIESAQHGAIIRLDAIEAGQAETKAWQAKADEKFAYLIAAKDDSKLAILELKDGQSRLEGRLEVGFAELKAGQGAIVGEMQKLAAHVMKVLNFAAKDEMGGHVSE